MSAARIEVLSGPLSGRIVPLGTGISIGREPGNELVLEDGTVSRRHAQVLPDGTGALVRDLGSRNGITLDGKPAREGRLAHGTRFSVGRISLRFLTEAAPPEGSETDGGTREAPPAARVPAAPAPVAEAAAPSAKPAKPPVDTRFLVFLGASALAVLVILVLWYRQTHAIPDVVFAPRKIQQDAESYEPVSFDPLHPPDRAFVKYELKDDAGVLDSITVYPPDTAVHNAISFRGRGQGQATLSLVHEDGRRTQLDITVMGRKPPAATLVVPPDAVGDPALLERFCLTKLGEAQGLAADGKYLKSLEICRGIVGLYRAILPKPPVVVEAQNQAVKLEDRLKDRLTALEEIRRHRTEQKDYDKVEETLKEMKDLVEKDSAAYQRLAYIYKVNESLRRAALQPKKDAH